MVVRAVRVVLADDNADMRDELRELLGAEFDVVDSVADGAALCAAVRAANPDVVVTDIAMPVLNGLAAAKVILRDRPQTRVVFVTVLGDPGIAQCGLALGALGYVSKHVAGAELLPAVRAALRGERYVAVPHSEPVRSDDE